MLKRIATAPPLYWLIVAAAAVISATPHSVASRRGSTA
jgi:hypothetical protein